MKLLKSSAKIFLFSVLVFSVSQTLLAQTGSINEPVRYIGGVTIDPNVHEGRLRYAIGVESIVCVFDAFEREFNQLQIECLPVDQGIH